MVWSCVVSTTQTYTAVQAYRDVKGELHLVAYKAGRIVVVDRESIRLGTAAWLGERALDSMSTAGQLEWSADSMWDPVRFDIGARIDGLYQEPSRAKSAKPIVPRGWVSSRP